MDPLWRLTLLGELRATTDDRRVIRFRTRKSGLLLAYLAYYRQRSHLRAELVELLWPELTPEAGRDNLSTVLSGLRRQLEPAGVPAGAVLIGDRASVRLNPEAVTTDVAEFKRALRAAQRAGNPIERARCLAQAVDRYRGPLLSGYGEEWVLQERPWLAENYFQALGELLAHLEQAGEFEWALALAQRGVSADPLREEAQRDLMRLYAAAGQPAAALRQYREMERLLQEALGATPEAATLALAREVERLSVQRPPSSAAPRIPGLRPTDARREPLVVPVGETRLATLLVARICRAVARIVPPDRDQPAARVNRLLSVMVDVLLKYEGRVDRWLGDGVLAIFGVPYAHEDDAERAIRAALEIREAAQKLGLAVAAGIDTGEVAVEVVEAREVAAGSGVQAVGDAPVVHRATRLQEQARPGQILVAPATYHRTCRAFAFSPLSPAMDACLSASSRGVPVADGVYRVEHSLARPQKAYGIEGLRAELIGRDDELSKLQQAVAAVLRPGAGGTGGGQIICLIGEAGLGKTRLVAEVKAAVRRPLSVVGSPSAGQLAVVPSESGRPATDDGQRPLWLEGRCLELGMTASYSLFVDLLRDLFAWRPEEDERARGARLLACLEENVAWGELTQERVEEMGPLLGNLLALRFDTDWDDRLKHAGPEQIKHQTFLAVRDFFFALARHRPLVLVLEDLHWADRHSLELISLLMETVPLAPLCLLCVYRPVREHRCSRLGSTAAQKCPGRCTELLLRELSPEQSLRLVESLLTIEDLPSSVEELILEKARGNPFFVEEVVRALIDGGQLYRAGAGDGRLPVWRARGGSGPIAVPESVQNLILSRVDRLRPDLKQLLQRASVIGRLFRRRLLEQAVSAGTVRGPQQERGWEAELWDLEEEGLIYQERVVPEEEYSFKHVLTQETIYGNLLPRDRARFHEHVGEALEALYPGDLDAHCEQLAYHYERSDVDEKAVEYLLKAGGKASRAYLNEAAIGYFQRALERLEGSALAESRQEWRLAALSGLGQIYHAVGRQAEAAERLQQAIEVGQSIGLAPRERVRLHFWLAEALWWQCRFDEMIRLGEEGLALLGEDTQSVEAALMNATVGEGHLHQGNEVKWREFTLRPVRSLDELPYSEELRPVYLHIVDVYAHLEKNVEEAMKWLRALEKKAEAHQDLRALGEAHSYAAMLLASEGDLRGAIARAQPAQELFTKIGDAKFENRALAGMVYCFLSLGDIQAAEECAYRVLRAAEREGEKQEITRQLMLIGTTALCQGSWERAADALRRAAQLYHERGTPREADPTFALGLMHLARGERWEASGKFRGAIVLARTTGFLTLVLSGLETAMEDAREFRAFCIHFRGEHPEVGEARFGQWFLEPAEPAAGFESPSCDALGAFTSPDWVWHDPFGDCAFAVENGLQIHAANGRDLWGLNVSAPRLLRAVCGDFAVQAVCHPASVEKPAIGGLLLWKDRRNFLRLDRGTRGRDEISFQACLGNKDVILGRGHLPAERVLLRLERLASRVNALCSADGREWFTVGHVEFPVEDPLDVGVHAIGSIDRTIYPGAYPEGTAIRFEAFQVWR
jgi:adenylate cyclase